MKELERYKKEVQAELENILSWWQSMTVDHVNGGFFGKIDQCNRISPEAPKGSVLNSRILWAFSSAYNLTRNNRYLVIADRAFHYFAQHFLDKEFGGVYWTVDYKGEPLDTRKQSYALAFAVYGLSEYYMASKQEGVKEAAIRIYDDIVVHSYDRHYDGYFEAFARDWQDIDDFRLSPKDANEKKSMNTHLHLLEAFSSLYRIWKDDSLRERVIGLLRIFSNQIIDRTTGHLNLFFDEQWNRRSGVISYGHDIEAAWLMLEAAETAGADAFLSSIKKLSANVSNAAAEGLDSDGGLWYEYDVIQDRLVREKHSWPQAEAMIGFFNAWQLSGDRKYLERSLKSWHFINDYMIDRKWGEWYWGVHADHSPMLDQEKAGMWKCPYHNSRACIEIITRIDNILNPTA